MNNLVTVIGMLFEIEAMEIHSPVTGQCLDYNVGSNYPADLPARSQAGSNER